MLLAADWSRQLFDLGQISRTVRYLLSEGDVTEPTVQAFHDAIKDAIQKLASGVSPMHASIRGFPFNVDEQTASSMKDQMMDSNDPGVEHWAGRRQRASRSPGRGYRDVQARLSGGL